jgi:hypothetical protein
VEVVVARPTQAAVVVVLVVYVAQLLIQDEQLLQSQP